MSTIDRLRSYLREYGVQDTAGRVFTSAIMRAFPRAFHQREIPTLGVLAGTSAGVFFSAAHLLREAGVGAAGQAEAVAEEYELLKAELAQRYREVRCPYPVAFAVEEQSSLLLYGLVRMLRPRMTIETGVANGHSSFLLLRALRANQAGALHSIDVGSDVGALLSEDEKRGWHLHLLDPNRLKQTFADTLTGIGPTDLFIHDSDHSYQWMHFELESAFAAWGPAATLCADDVHLSCAFVDVCREHQLRPNILLDRRKAFGVVLRSAV